MTQTNPKKNYVSPIVTTIEIQTNNSILAGNSGNAGGDNMGNGGEYGRSHNEELSPWDYEQ